jgi:Membrane protease subunits, stomatin/prohibitin homologs
MQTERERQAKQYRAEGAEEAQKIRSEAEKDREIILAQAYKESEELRGAGDAKAFRVYADAYRQDPHFFEFTRSMEAYKKTFKDKSTMVWVRTQNSSAILSSASLRTAPQSPPCLDRFQFVPLPASSVNPA